MDSLIKSLQDSISGHEMLVYSITDYQNGKTTNYVLQDMNKRNIYSLSKNIISLAIGILIDQQRLKLADTVVEIFQDDYDKEILSNYKDVTIEDLLKQVTGLDVFFLDVDKDDVSQYTDNDYLKMVLKKKLNYKPGEHFNYSDSNYYVLSCVIKKITHHNSQMFIDKEIFKPLGIHCDKYLTDLQGNAIGATGIFLNSEDVNKIGQVYLNKGMYSDKKIVSEEYIKQATKKLVNVGDSTYYGLSIWQKESTKYFYGNGMFGQINFINIAKNRVISILSDIEDNRISYLEKILYLREDD